MDSDGFEMLSSSSTDKGKGKASDVEAIQSVAKLLSDWHLLAFLDTVGIFDVADMKLMSRVATFKKGAEESGGNEEDMKKLLTSSAWRTLVTIASEHSCEFLPGIVLSKITSAFMKLT